MKTQIDVNYPTSGYQRIVAIRDIATEALVGVTQITFDIGHPKQVNPRRFRIPKLPQNVRFHQTPRSQNHRSRVSDPSWASIAAAQPLRHVKT